MFGMLNIICIFADRKAKKQNTMSTATLTNLRDYLYGTLSPTNMIWLGTQLTEYGHQHENHAPVPYTMEEVNDMLDVAEANFEAGLGIPHEEVMREWEEEIAREEQKEHDLAEAV